MPGLLTGGLGAGSGGGGGGGGTSLTPGLTAPSLTASAMFNNTGQLTIAHDFGSGVTPQSTPNFAFGGQSLTKFTATAPSGSPAKAWAAPLTVPAGGSITVDLTALAGGTAPAGVTVSLASLNMLLASVSGAVGSGAYVLLGGDGTAAEFSGKLSTGGTSRVTPDCPHQDVYAAGYTVSPTGARLVKLANPTASAVVVVFGVYGS